MVLKPYRKSDSPHILLDVFPPPADERSRRSDIGRGKRQAASPGFFRLRWLSLQEVVLGAVLVLAVIALSFLSDRFLTPANLLNQTRFLTEVALLAVPMTFVIILGGIDLSVGSIVAFSAVLLGFSWLVLGFPLWLAVLVGIAGGTLAGYLNGLVIVYLGVPPLISPWRPSQSFVVLLMVSASRGHLTDFPMHSRFGAAAKLPAYRSSSISWSSFS